MHVVEATIGLYNHQNLTNVVVMVKGLNSTFGDTVSCQDINTVSCHREGPVHALGGLGNRGGLMGPGPCPLLSIS